MAEGGFLPPIIGHLRADISGWAKGMAEAKAETEAATGHMGKAFNGMAAAGKVVGATLVGAAVIGGGAALKMAGDYEASTNRLVTSAGEQRGALDGVRKGMLQMAGEVGISAQELARAMYVVDSAGFTAAKGGLTVLRAAAEGAKAEGADLKVVADAVTTALIDYHKGADQAAQVTTTLIAAVSVGKTSFGELTGALHSVLPKASAAGISLADITAALASMTMHGMSADQAAQNLAHAIEHLQTTTAPQRKELALLGIDANNLSKDLGEKGLTGTILMIDKAIQDHMGKDKQVVLEMQDALRNTSPEVQKLGRELMVGTISMGDYNKATKDLTGVQAGQAAGFATLLKATHGIGSGQKTGAEIMQSYAAAMKAATGDSTTLSVALMLGGENAKSTTDNVKAVSGATVEAGNHVAGWAEIQKTFNQHLAQGAAKSEALGITIGTILIPYAITAMDKTAQFTDYLSKNKDASIALAAAIGVPLVAAITAYIIQVGISAGATVIATTRTLAHAAATVVLAVVTQGQAVAAFISLAVQYGILNALSVTTIGMWAAKTAATIANTAVTVAHTVAAGAAAVATGIWTGAQWLLNAAFVANPIGIVIVVIAALVAGVIYAYNHWGWFHDAVNKAWDGLKSFGHWIEHTLGPILSSLGEWIGKAAGALGGLIEKAGKLPGISAAAQSMAADASLPGRAAGGPVSAGGAYLVGESGPEMLVMGSQGGQVYPYVRDAGGAPGTGSTGDMAALVQEVRNLIAQLQQGGGQQQGITINAQSNADPRQIASELVWAMKTG